MNCLWKRPVFMDLSTQINTANLMEIENSPLPWPVVVVRVIENIFDCKYFPENVNQLSRILWV